MNKEYSVIINVIKNVLNLKTEQIDAASADGDILYLCASSHCVCNTVAYGVKNVVGLSDTAKSKFEMGLFKAAWQQTVVEDEMKNVLDELEKEKVKSVFLKGFLLKDLYPESAMRSMGDVDVFITESDVSAAQKVMERCGFIPDVIGEENHYSFVKNDIVKVEFHPELVALDSEYGRHFAANGGENGKISDLMELYSHTENIDGYEYMQRLSPEYHYVYVIMHAFNHFLTAGTGIRTFCDVFVMRKAYKGTWDEKIIAEQLQKFKLKSFEKYSVAIAEKWFGDGDISGVDKDTLEEFESYILESGTYGNTKNKIATELNHSGGFFNKIGLVLKKFFLPYGKMAGMYPSLKKCPILLPFYWIYRLFEKRKKGKNNLQIIFGDDDGKERNKLFSELTDK